MFWKAFRMKVVAVRGLRVANVCSSTIENDSIPHGLEGWLAKGGGLRVQLKR
jgi:hypothetical protein